MPKVSIIVAAYNAEPYLETAMRSLAAQTLTDIEVIVVDDGSHDNTDKIADQFAATDTRFRVIHQSNKGLGETHNVGIAASTGEYIGFVDADDWVEPEMFASMYQLAKETNAQVTICDYIEDNLFQGTSRILRHPLPNRAVLDKDAVRTQIVQAYYRRMVHGIYTQCNKIYAKQFLDSHRIRVDRRNHGPDFFFNLRVFIAAERVVGLHEPLYHYVRQNLQALDTALQSDFFTWL